MNKKQFLDALRNGLSGLPQDDVDEHLTFYSEILEDRMDEGVSEEAALAEFGCVEDIIAQIKADTPLAKIVKSKLSRSRRKLTTLEIVLLIVGFPIWFSLLVSAFAVVLSLYVSWWAVIISLWSVFVSLDAVAFTCILAGIVIAFSGNIPSSIVLVAMGIISTGLCIFAFYGCRSATRGTLLLTKRFVLWLKYRLVGKE